MKPGNDLDNKKFSMTATLTPWSYDKNKNIWFRTWAFDDQRFEWAANVEKASSENLEQAYSYSAHSPWANNEWGRSYADSVEAAKEQADLMLIAYTKQKYPYG